MRSETYTPIDVSRLECAKVRGGRLIARCPACAARGGDKRGEHFVAFDGGSGKWGCVAFPGSIEHRREIAAAIGGEARPFEVPPLPPKARVLDLPALRYPSLREMFRIAELRGLPCIAGLEMAAKAGVLHTATLADMGLPVNTWLLTDAQRVSAQARRLDGKPWAGIGGAKAKTLPGSQAAWPIGAANIGTRPFVALCEGGPDMLAAWTLAWWFGRADEIAPVCMTGAGNRIHQEALVCFKGKGVWTFPHQDDAGARAQAMWRDQLMSAGAKWVQPFDLAGLKDLNDWLAAESAAMEDTE